MNCNQCGAPIKKKKMDSGKTMVLDARSIMVVPDGEGVFKKCYTLHRNTCVANGDKTLPRDKRAKKWASDRHVSEEFTAARWRKYIDRIIYDTDDNTVAPALRALRAAKGFKLALRGKSADTLGLWLVGEADKIACEDHYGWIMHVAQYYFGCGKVWFGLV